MKNQVLISLINERQKLADLLRKCSKYSSYFEGKQIHGAIMRKGYVFDLMLNNDMIDMYGKCQRIDLAHVLFDKMPERNVVSWTALMCGYLRNGKPEESLWLFREMGVSDEKPNEYTLSTNVKACGIVGVVENGMQVHGVCCKVGVDCSPVVGNSVIDMYSRCGKINDAERMFRFLSVRSLITWNVMIGAYAVVGTAEKSLILFKKMQEVGEVPDEFTFTSTLKACNVSGAIREGTQIHAFLIVTGCSIEVKKIIAGALIDLYVKCGRLFEADKLFNQVEDRSVISWTSLIIGHAQEGKLSKAMDLFRRLRKSSLQVDAYVLSSMIAVFADFALAELGKQAHSYAIKLPAGLDISVANSVVDMYIKCGLMEEAETYFTEMKHKNVISWTVMITGYGKYGLGKQAVSVFKNMLSNNVEPDDVTYLAVLSACSHAGLVEESREYFMQLCNNKRVKPRVEHYACMVDILGRAGQLEEAQNLIKNMPVKPNTGIWQTLLGACRVHRNVKMGKEVGQILLKLDGDNPVNYVMMSNIFADAGCWKECEKLRRKVQAKGLKKEAGRSWVEFEKEIHFFYNGDQTHPLTESIHNLLQEMEKKMKEEVGYANEVSFSLHDVEEESKVESMRVHSEKLAIGFALLSHGVEKGGKPIFIFKNLRVCGDCHEFIKGISKVLVKVFLVRDANRFHKFENGTCSCGDYW